MTKLHWHVSGSEIFDPEPEASTSSKGPRRGFRITPFLLGLYVSAVVVAGWLGFTLGRSSILDQELIRSVENQLAIESLAWRDSDVALYASTLDPSAPPEWRDWLQTTMARAGPATYSFTLKSRRETEPGVIVAVIEVTNADGTTREEQRMYRRIQGAWVQTMPMGDAFGG